MPPPSGSFEKARLPLEQEMAARRETALESAADQARQGKPREAMEALIFYSEPSAFTRLVPDLIAGLLGESAGFSEERGASLLSFFVQMAAGLRSFLPRWNLAHIGLHGERALSLDASCALAAKFREAAAKLGKRMPGAELRFLQAEYAYALARYRAEEDPDPAARAAALVGASAGEYADNLIAEIDGSNLLAIAVLRDERACPTEIANDYAAFLDHALYLGASFCTTNPPLVDMAWKALPEKWDPAIQGIVQSHCEAPLEDLSRLVTLEIVGESLRLLRPVFLLTAGEMGCVCLQVNPHLDTADAMVDEALWYYEHLCERLHGGVPNVRFKIIGTQAGLEAARILVRRGIGVTITVNFGMFQHIPFAQALAEGAGTWSCLVEMNGRLAFPIRDELLAKAEELQEQGISEGAIREAAAWAGVAIARRLHAFLQKHGIDTRTVRTLIASLRIYRGDGYENLPGPFPDITECLGAGIISVFPNIRGPYDRANNASLSPDAMARPIPAHALRVLAHSEIFRQAWRAPGEDLTGPLERLVAPPDHPIALENEDAVARWTPVRETLSQFRAAYDAFVESIRALRA